MRNVNFEEPELRNVEIPTDFLTKTYLGRCNFDYKASCSGPQGEIADFNVWSTAKSVQELKDWTKCK